MANREPSDLDLIGSYDEAIGFCKSQKELKSLVPIDNGNKLHAKFYTTNIEVEIAWSGSSAEKIMNLISTDPETQVMKNFLIPSIHVLYLLKMSHRYLKNSPFFKKTMDDIWYLRSLGAEVKPEHQEVYRARVRKTYNYNHPKLNVNKNDFFKGDGVIYIYDHDSIHEAIKHFEQPAYSFFKKEDEEVLCSKELFYGLKEEIRLNAVLEEAYVLALERSQIPFRGNVEPFKSFEMALMKICTSITSGWFREYAWENYAKIVNLYDEKYADKFFIKADQGLVKFYGG